MNTVAAEWAQPYVSKDIEFRFWLLEMGLFYFGKTESHDFNIFMLPLQAGVGPTDYRRKIYRFPPNPSPGVKRDIRPFGGGAGGRVPW